MAVVKIAGKKGFSGAGQYFDDHLASGDYHDQEGKSPGIWIGKGAEELDLKGIVKREDFMALTENLDPRTGKTLTARMNTVREGGVSNRRAFYDIGFAPPKSISIAALVHGDERIIAAHNLAVKRAVEEVFEPLASANVRSKNDPDYGKGPRQTGNLTAAVFQHDTSRATMAGAAPDPQLHSHVVVMNATKDGENWKALETHEMHQAQKLAAATYDHYLVEQLHEMGYSIREARDGSWEMAHIGDDTIQKFSGRNIQIKERAAELKASGVEGSMDQLKANAANFDRVKKDGNLTTEGLREVWRGEMTAAELNPVIGERIYSTNITAEDSIKWAKLHCFERSAVVSKNQFITAALGHARGAKGVTKEMIEKAFKADAEILHGEAGKISTKEVLDRENYIVNSVIQGKEKYAPLAPGFAEGAEKMNPMQMDAAQRIISSKDFVTVFRGGAGVGKSFALEHVKNALEGAGHPVTILAPQNKQVEGLKNDGLEDAQYPHR